MDFISKLAWKFSAGARERRAEVFRSFYKIDKQTRILDLGSADGTHIAGVLEESEFEPTNIYIADMNAVWLEQGHSKFGFHPVLIDEAGQFPFQDNFFDIVFCSSVIEHVTVPKADIWKCRNEREFRARSFSQQKIFANEIKRIGRQYFVQTPSRSFPVESHTWLPFAGYLPRNLLLRVVSLSNRFWVRYAEPDFCLLGKTEMKELFPDAEIVVERKLGFTKSLMAIKSGTNLNKTK